MVNLLKTIAYTHRYTLCPHAHTHTHSIYCHISTFIMKSAKREFRGQVGALGGVFLYQKFFVSVAHRGTV